MSYAAAVRPVIDRVYGALRAAGDAPQGGRVRAVYQDRDLRPGLETSFYFGLLARPMPAQAFRAATCYDGDDMSVELEQGTMRVDADLAWHLTGRGQQVASAVQSALGATAEELWQPEAGWGRMLPGAVAWPALVELLGQLLEVAAVTGGPVCAAVLPVYEPQDATPAVRLTTRLAALRHHRADAHRAAWRKEGLTVEELRSIPGDAAVRSRIEAETDRLDDQVYDALSTQARLELLAGLGALPG